ncbi:MAG: hypothetical protein K2O06_03010 [Acetatifactor sp.]|nr:hypothetical protein [Acetatifactor sp.]
MKNTSRKNTAAIVLTLIWITAFICCACGKSDDDSPSSSVIQDSRPKADSISNTDAGASGSSPQKGAPVTQSAGETGTDALGLRFLCADDGENGCSDSNGYYYLNYDDIKLSDGSYGSHLMYMDYASCREIFLCSTPGCNHDSPDCTAVLPSREFPPFSTKLFLFQDHLYALCCQADAVVSLSAQSASGEDSSFMSGNDTIDHRAGVLYRMNPDGTGREKVYEFASGLTIEGTLAIDHNGLYVITKKLSSEKTETGSYTSASEESLMYLNLSSFEAQTLCSLDFGDNISWKVTGCAGGAILLRGTDYGRKLTTEEYNDNGQFKVYFQNSHEVFALLDPSTGSLREFYRISNARLLSTAVMNDTLYISIEGGDDIIGVNPTTGEQWTVASLPQTYIWDTLEDVLCCSSWNAGQDYTFYFVNVKTGEAFHSGLVNKSLGWRLEFKAETGRDVLVIYDYEAAPSALNDGGYEITREIYGLISREDLFAGKDNYREIQMSGKGY